MVAAVGANVGPRQTPTEPATHAAEGRAGYPAAWPPDPDPANRVAMWSRHWDAAGSFNPRCPRCRELGEACEGTQPR
jgi:hypothetical protein